MKKTQNILQFLWEIKIVLIHSYYYSSFHCVKVFWKMTTSPASSTPPTYPVRNFKNNVTVERAKVMVDSNVENVIFL